MFQTAATSETDALQFTQPNSNGERVYFRSTDAADTSKAVTLSGRVAGVSSFETNPTNSSDGRVEILTTSLFESLKSAAVDSVCAGALRFYGTGVSGQGRIEVNSVPAHGNAFRVALAGVTTKEYILTSPSRHTITCLPASALSGGEYFQADMGLAYGNVFVWFTKDGAMGLGAPTDTGLKIRVDTFTGDDDEAVAAAAAVALQAGFETLQAAHWLAQASGGVVTLTSLKLNEPVISVADSFAPTGFTFATVAAGTVDSTDERLVRTAYGLDGAAVTAADVAGYIAIALNANPTDGQSAGADTSPNEYVTAVAGGSTVTLTDLIPCRRQLGWDITQTVGTSLSIVPMIGGSDGTILATLPAGTTQLFDPVTLDSVDLSSATLPAGVAPTFLEVYVGGAAAEWHFRCANVVTPIPLRYEWSDDPDRLVWTAGANSITSLDNMAATSPQRVAVAERAEWVRLVITGNANTTDSAVDARLVWASGGG